MKISIFTDASCVGDKAGYAFYIGCREGKIQKAGRLRKRTGDILIAEMHCIANALHTLKHSKFSQISVVWIFSDRLDVINILTNETRSFRKADNRAITEEIRFLMMEICLREKRSIRDIDKMFVINHFKAHTAGRDIKTKINDWCDSNARKYAKMKPLKTSTNGKHI